MRFGGFAIDSSLIPLILRHGLPLVALLVFLGELGIPTGVPVEIALLLTGAYAVHSFPALIVGILLVSVADLAGATSLHLLVRTGGVHLLRKFRRTHEVRREESMARWRKRLGGHDISLIFVARLLPLVRMYITIATGLMRVRIRNFILAAAPAGLIWAGTPLVLGYAFRADVHRWEARYTTTSHLLLALLPLFGLGAGIILWIRRASTPQTALRRVRSALGALAAIATSGYLARFIWVNDWEIEHGSAMLPRPVLGIWIVALAAIICTLFTIAYIDFRTSLQHRTPLVDAGRMKAFFSNLAWAGVVGIAGAIPLALELRYPAL